MKHGHVFDFYGPVGFDPPQTGHSCQKPRLGLICSIVTILSWKTSVANLAPLPVRQYIASNAASWPGIAATGAITA